MVSNRGGLGHFWRWAGAVWGGVRGPELDRHGETLFINARSLGTRIDRVHRVLTDTDVQKIVSTCHASRRDIANPPRPRDGGEGGRRPDEWAACADIAGFCRSATTAAHGHVLTPGRYVGAEEVEDDGEPFDEKMPRLVAELHAQFAESAKLKQALMQELLTGKTRLL